MFEDEPKNVSDDMLRVCRFRAHRVLQRGEQFDEDIEQCLRSKKLTIVERVKLQRADVALFRDQLLVAKEFRDLETQINLDAHKSHQEVWGNAYWMGQIMVNTIGKCHTYKIPLPDTIRTRVQETRNQLNDILSADEQYRPHRDGNHNGDS